MERGRPARIDRFAVETLTLQKMGGEMSRLP